MKIALAFDLRSDEPHAAPTSEFDDAEEEFDSPETIQALTDALIGLGHEVEPIGSGVGALRRLLDGPRPDLVFNLAEGRGTSRCREAWLPAALEMLGVPFTGSDALTMAATLDKDCAKRIVLSAGVSTPSWLLVRPGETRPALDGLSYPRIVKPAFEGSSKGVLPTSLVHTRAELERALEHALSVYRQPILIEEFIDGEELTVAVMGCRTPHVLGTLRVIPRERSGPFIYDLVVKRDWRRRVVYEAPARLSEAADAALRSAALAAYHALGCRDLARLDFRVAGDRAWFLEVNPLPGLSPETGDVVILAKGHGLSYAELVERIVAEASERIALPTARAPAQVRG